MDYIETVTVPAANQIMKRMELKLSKKRFAQNKSHSLTSKNPAPHKLGMKLIFKVLKYS